MWPRGGKGEITVLVTGPIVCLLGSVSEKEAVIEELRQKLVIVNESSSSQVS